VTTPLPPQQLPGAEDFAEHLVALRARLRLVQDLEESDQSIDVVADLETAYEELRVADEEVRTQHDQISRLLQHHNVMLWQHERMLAALPVPALVTDANGVIRSLNAAAATLVSMRVARLLGRPIFTLFEPADRSELRSLLVGGSGPVPSQVATVVPQAGDPVRVEVSAAVRPGDAVEVTWLLLTPGRWRSRGALGVLPEALTELAGLPAQGLPLQEVVSRAVEICRRSLGEPEVSISLGPPEQPDAVSSSSALAAQVDGAQVRAGQGPSPTAFAATTLVSSPDLQSDARWPRLAGLLPHHKVSALAVPVEVGQRLVGTLTVYGENGPLEHWVEEAAELLGATLGAVFYELELNAEVDRLGRDMERALSSRATIEQAKGIIMAQQGCAPDEAFARLAELSSRQERKVRDVAAEIVDEATSGA
jgi:PAS domain-containing protein